MKKIAIDPGHFGGTLSLFEDRHFMFEGLPAVKEGDLNFVVSQKLKTLLTNDGYKVLLSRKSYDGFEGAKKFTKEDYEKFKIKNWEERVMKINEFVPDLTLSVHFNSNCYSSKMFETKDNGVMTFIHSKHSEQLVNWAKIFSIELKKAFKLPFCQKKWFMDEVNTLWEDLGSGVNVRDLYILRNVKYPTILTEGPLINNKETFKQLINGEELLKVYAEALYNGVLKIFSCD